MKKYYETIKTISLFSEIADDDLPSLLSCLSATVKSYAKDEVIFRAGEPAQMVGIVLSGGVQIIKEDFMGNRTIMAALFSGELFGEAFACTKTLRLPVSVVATANSEIMLINYRKIITTCPSSCVFHARLIENMLGIVASKNVALSQKVEIISRRSTREKLIAYLSDQAQKMGTRKFSIPFNRQELADYLCVERSAMSAELSKMRRSGLIRTEKNEFELLYTPEELDFSE